MQQSSHIGNARREERMLLPALIELRSEQGEDTLTADGLDVSPSGLAVRAAFVPEVGTRLYCHFRCPPRDDAVYALGEVVWSAWEGAHAGSFGLRFLELDTKSATAIRRYLEADPREIEQPRRARTAQMHIDGLAAPIEADVKLLEKGCIVLEQELGFLRLGRGIEVDVPGREKRRGRIGSIELRQGPFDTPTLVFGVLLDEARQPVSGEHLLAELHGRARAQGREGQPTAAPPALVPGEERQEPPRQVRPPPRNTRAADEPRVVRHVEARGPARELGVEARAPGREPLAFAEPEDEAETRALQSRLPDGLLWLSTAFKTLSILLRAKLLPSLRALWTRSSQQLGALREAGSSWSARLRAPFTDARALLSARWIRLLSRRGRRRTTAPSLRVQKAAPPVRVQRGEAPPPRRIGRFVTAALALLGIGLGVYALAPRSGADRIRVRQRAALAVEGAQTAAVEPRPAAPGASAGAPTAKAPAASAAAAATISQSAPAEPAAENVRFGEPQVPNGRSFVLRMSGPVQSIEGEGRPDGFTVRIPGRLALDRASPIATSHRAVARALILNRGDYAELTVEFLPGMRPKYQILGKGSSLEVTIERM